ncbi:HK97 family phage prohead protease [Candidatus Woesearchaeota archaeon]|nr:HK97 family phage prohead protease [Candidatus Woesearchaeota archaeon]
MEEVLIGYTPDFNAEIFEKKGVKEYVVSGYISTPEVDLVNDVVTKSCMEDMLAQIKAGNVKLDFEHETIHEENLDKNPVGRIVDAKLDSKGLWVKAILNSANERFKEIWGSIKGGFLNAFSIAFKAVEAVTKYLEGKTVRLLNKVKLVNVGLTGTPVNEECRMDGIFVKAIKKLEDDADADVEEKALCVTEEGMKKEGNVLFGKEAEESNSSEKSGDNKTMAEEEKTPVEEAKPEETAPEAGEEDNSVETESVAEEEEKSESEDTEKAAPAEETSEPSEKVADKAEVKALRKENANLKARVSKLEKILEKPEMKAKLESAPQKQINENDAATPLSMIK